VADVCAAPAPAAPAPKQCEHEWIENKAYPLSDTAAEVCSKCWVGKRDTSDMAYMDRYIGVTCQNCGHQFDAQDQIAMAAPAPAAQAEPFGFASPTHGNYFTRNKTIADRIGGLIPVYASPQHQSGEAGADARDAAMLEAISALLPVAADGASVGKRKAQTVIATLRAAMADQARKGAES
jgi:hypothetical protein